jgi:hypothetical protein
MYTLRITGSKQPRNSRKTLKLIYSLRMEEQKDFYISNIVWEFFYELIKMFGRLVHCKNLGCKQ